MCQNIRMLFRRATALFIDMLILLPFILLSFYLISSALPVTTNIRTYDLILTVVELCIVSVKDIFGHSLGKHIMELRIIPLDADRKISVLYRILRNVTLIIWPVEVVFLIVTGNRLTDRLLGLSVVYIGSDNKPYDDNSKTNKEAIVMQNELDSMMGFEKLGLYYEVHMAGIDGECFMYHVYLNVELTQEKTDEVSKAIDESVNARNDEDHYIGYADVCVLHGQLYVFLDIGSAAPEDADKAIYGVLETLNNIEGIDRVIINEE